MAGATATSCSEPMHRKQSILDNVLGLLGLLGSKWVTAQLNIYCNTIVCLRERMSEGDDVYTPPVVGGEGAVEGDVA
eukprot:COSAG02_NODE_13477_length_1389_cov_2.460465_2_plen_77_part_00